MKKAAMAVGIGVSIGIAATIAATGLRPNGDVAAGVARSVVTGAILGSHAWPYDWNIAAADYRTRLQLWSSLCGWQGQCDGYGLAAARIGDSDRDPGR